MTNFNELQISDKIVSALTKINYNELTPVQEEVIPNILENKDVLGCSQTGSGKTGAFLIPILSRLLSDKTSSAIIIAPTRELATQIAESANSFCDKNKDIKKALLIGGAGLPRQIDELNRKPRLIIGTPGRISDHIRHGKLNLEKFNVLVLDEMDRMLDMGFSVQIDEIIKYLSTQRQVLMFSATLSKKIEKLSQKYLVNPVVVKIGDTNQPATNIKQEIIDIQEEKKFDLLLEKLKSTTFALVFVKTKNKVDKIQKALEEQELLVRGIHSGLRQTKREKIIKDFRNKKFNILVATDVAARGLDIHHIDTVINYDLPDSPEDYIHRIGRSSRSLESIGLAISFVCKRDVDKWFAIKSLIKDGDYEEPKFNKGKEDKKGSRSRSRNRRTQRPFKKDFETKNDRNYKDKKDNSSRDKEDCGSKQTRTYKHKDYAKKSFSKAKGYGNRRKSFSKTQDK